MNKRAILINSKDNVVTTLDALVKGDEIVFSAQEKTESIKVNEDIRIYNKIASKDIKKGDIILINCKNQLEWLKYRLIRNRYFLNRMFNYFIKNNKKYDIIDCNDPDALYLGILYKLRYRSKVVYDSHEFWKGTRRIETNFLYTMYSIFANTLQYWKEKRYARFVDSILVVSPEIKDELKKVYSQKLDIIYNFPCKINGKTVKKCKKIAFLGQKLRAGVNKIMQDYNKKGYECHMVGEMKPVLDFVKYHGWMDRKDYLELLNTCEFGVVYSNITCRNVKYSLPNKLFEYLQMDCKPIINPKMVSCKRLLEDLNKGKIKKEDLIWEAQEDKLLKIYNNL